MKAENAVILSKFKYLIRLLNRLKKSKKCHIDFYDEVEESEVNLTATQDAFAIINSYLKYRGRLMLTAGVFAGFVLGLIAAYVIIPSGVTYLYSSDKGLIPPKYDALFKTKKTHEQVMQILTHETKGEKKRRGGPLKGNQMVFVSQINDTVSIELWYQLSKKSIIANISQKKGEQYIRSTVKKSMERSGVDSAAKYYAGVEQSNVAGDVSDAVSRTTAMKIEQGFLAKPVLRVIINGRKSKKIFTNFLPWQGENIAEFSIDDCNPADVLNGDNTKENRQIRVPVDGERELFDSYINLFIRKFIDEQS